MRASERGYSLTEALVALAIVGMVSVVTVPAFIAMSHQNRAKTSMGQFTADLRKARQRAVTQIRMVKVSFPVGTTARSYTITESTNDPSTAPASITWTATPVGSKVLDITTYLASSNFTDIDSDGTCDVVFLPSGALRANGGSYGSNIVLQSEFTDIAKRSYTISFSPTGTLNTK